MDNRFAFHLPHMCYCECYSIISTLDYEYINLFNKIWIKNDQERFAIIDGLLTEKGKVISKRRK